MKTIMAIAVALIGFSNAHSADFSQRIETPSGIVIHLPAGWRQIPEEIIIAQFEEVARQNPNVPKQTYEYGFQVSSDKWFEYPYLLVKIQRTGRIPEEALKKMPNLDDMMRRKMDETAEAASTITDATMDKTVYDSANQVLWISARMNIAGFGNIKMLAGGHLSEDGFVQIFGYAREEDFARYETLLHDIISNVELPVGMRYVQRARGNREIVHTIDWDKTLTKVIIGAVLAGLVGLIIGLIRR